MRLGQAQTGTNLGLFGDTILFSILSIYSTKILFIYYIIYIYFIVFKIFKLLFFIADKKDNIIMIWDQGRERRWWMGMKTDEFNKWV